MRGNEIDRRGVLARDGRDDEPSPLPPNIVALDP
jgi:hypothetical protein